MVEAVGPTSVIEVGVGLGAVGARLASLTSGGYVGVETDATSCQRARRALAPLGGVVHNQPLRLVGPPPADILCAFEVLEHIEDDRGALAEWVDYVVPKGHVCLSVPRDPERFGAMDEYAGHFRRYSRSQLAGLLESAGLEVVTMVAYGAPLGYAIEAVRNVTDARKLRRAAHEGVSRAELTAASGRTFQFNGGSWSSAVASAGVLPFRYLQKIWPGGIGWVALGRRA
jgi:SAM-dependent methyltransferase